jgi:NADH-quinone oxidoreductase subunit G
VLRAGAHIPYYCYHPGLSVVAQCRMCLVEVADMGNGKPMPKLQAACATPAAGGMKVLAKSAKVIEAQNEVNEYLLVNHPLDCPICDQAGECDLQDFAFAYGSGRSEMEYEKRVYGWRDVGTYIALERNRCVHCSRCERFSREVEGGHDFGMFLRSHELTFDTYDDAQITHPYQGNLVDLCPVGAITEREFRFKKRAWKLTRTESVCGACATGCNITMDHHRNKVERFKPRENQAVNRWWMCDFGRLSYRALNGREHRPMEPLARVKGELVAAGWDAVYAAIAGRARALGAKGAAVVGLADPHATNEELALFRALLGSVFGATAVYFPEHKEQDPPAKNFLHGLLSGDRAPNRAGARALELTGDPDGAQARKALGSARIVLVLGSAFEEQESLRQAAAKAGLIVQITARFDAWRDTADVILPGQTYAEKFGTFTNKHGRVQRIQPALHAPQDTREETRILQELMIACGQERPVQPAKDVLAGLGKPFAGLSWESVGNLGAPLPGGE